jgi:hypothetical protein
MQNCLGEQCGGGLQIIGRLKKITFGLQTWDINEESQAKHA